MDNNLEEYNYLNKEHVQNLSGQIFLSGYGSPIKPYDQRDMICSDCNHKILDKNADCPNFTKPENFPDNSISYIFNKHKYRSDDFDKEKTSSNFLFAGCSYGMGTGLPLDSTWTKQINRNFNKDRYFNISVNGGSPRYNINDIYKYIRIFGKPEAIFIFWATIERLPVFHSISKDSIDTTTDFVDYYKIIKQNVDAYKNDISMYYDFMNNMKNLEDYLESINVPVIWSVFDVSWSERIELGNFRGFVNLHNGYDMYDFMVEHNDPIPPFSKKYWNNARDRHPSGKENFYVAKKFTEEYNRIYVEAIN